MEQYYNSEFLKQLYKEEYGDFNFIKEDFLQFISIVTGYTELAYILYNNEFSREELEEIPKKFNSSSIAVYKKRLKEENYIQVTKTEGKKEWVTLSNYGLEQLNLYFTREFISKNHYIQKNLKLLRKNNIATIEEDPLKHKQVLIDFMNYLEKKPNFQHFLRDGFLKFSIIDILEHSVELGEYIIEDFEKGFSLIQECLREFIGDEEEYELMKHNIKIIELDKIKTQHYQIDEIPKGKKELIFVKGILAKKKKRINEKIEWFFHFCTNPDCNYSREALKVNNKLKQCAKCKSALVIDGYEAKKVHTYELKDHNSDIGLDLIIKDDLIPEVNRIHLGENVSVIGYMDSREVKDNTTQEFYIQKEMIVNSLYQSDNLTQLNKEDEAEVLHLFEKLQKQNITPRDFLLQGFTCNFPYPLEVFTFSLIPQVLTYKKGKENMIHLLFIGSPDTGKSTFLETLGLIFPKSRDIQLNQLSEAKFYGTVTQEGLSDVGLVMSSRDGSLIIDEIDKDKDSFDKSANMLNELLEKQKATKEKAGISIRLDNINLRVYGILNPDSARKYDPITWACKNIHESTLTRFFYINVDYFIKNNEKDFIIKNETKGGLSDLYSKDFSLHQKLILYLRTRNIDLSLIEDKLIMLQQEIRKTTTDFNELASRNIKQLKNIVIALSRLNGREQATMEELTEGLELLKFMFETRGESLETAGKNLQSSLILREELRNEKL